MKKKSRNKIILGIIVIGFIIGAIYFSGVFNSIVPVALGQWNKFVVDTPGVIKQGEVANASIILQPGDAFIAAGRDYKTYYTYSIYVDDIYKSTFSGTISNRALVNKYILDSTTNVSGIKNGVLTIGIGGLDIGKHKITTKFGTNAFEHCDYYDRTITVYQTKPYLNGVYYQNKYQCQATEYFFENKVNASLIMSICGLPEKVNGSYYCRGIGGSACTAPYCCHCGFDEALITTTINRDYLNEISYGFKTTTDDYFYIYTDIPPVQEPECDKDVYVNCTSTQSITALKCINGTYTATGYICSLDQIGIPVEQNQTSQTNVPEGGVVVETATDYTIYYIIGGGVLGLVLIIVLLNIKKKKK